MGRGDCSAEEQELNLGFDSDRREFTKVGSLKISF